MTAHDEFRTAMRQFGLDYNGPLDADGKIHRFKSAGDHGRNAWYVLYYGPPAAGAFGCWKRGLSETWCAARNRLSQAEWSEAQTRWREADRQRALAEEERHRRARNVAAWIIARSKPAAATHPYLARKQVSPVRGLLEYRGDLTVPLRDIDGTVHSLQFISPDGTKKYLTGGRVSGCFFAIPGDVSQPVIICEGLATGISIHLSTGFSVVCAMNCGNLPKVAQAVRDKWPGREIILAADNDLWIPKNPGLTKGTEAARAVGARLAFPKFADTSAKPSDFNDLALAEGSDIVRGQITAATAPGETEEELLDRLAKLPPLQYERERAPAAVRLGIPRLSALDAEVAARRPKSESDSGQGAAVKLPEIDLWPEMVNGPEVLAAISSALSDYVALPAGAADTIALWCAVAHCFQDFEHSPRLNLCSPEKGCGKTLALDVLSCFCPRFLRCESLTPAVLFRLADSHRPTLGLDEYDSYLTDNEELRGLLNAGHKRGARAFRCEGDGNVVRGFNAFCPAVLAGIGHLPGTLHDRSIVIGLTRAKPGEVKKRFDSRHTESERELCRKLARWIADNKGDIAACDPVLPDGAFNRLADNWRPLFAVAQCVGGNWPARARESFRLLTSTADLDAHGVGSMLLQDIQFVFARLGEGRVSSKFLAEELAEFEGRPWAEFGKSRKPISANQLAQQLRRFGISPRMMQIPGEAQNRRGYDVSDFTEAFARFLPPTADRAPESGLSESTIDPAPPEREPAMATNDQEAL